VEPEPLEDRANAMLAATADAMLARARRRERR